MITGELKSNVDRVWDAFWKMLVGSDNSHTVVAEHAENGRKRLQDLAPLQPVASPAVAAFLDSRLASGAAGARTMIRG